MTKETQRLHDDIRQAQRECNDEFFECQSECDINDQECNDECVTDLTNCDLDPDGGIFDDTGYEPIDYQSRHQSTPDFEESAREVVEKNAPTQDVTNQPEEWDKFWNESKLDQKDIISEITSLAQLIDNAQVTQYETLDHSGRTSKKLTIEYEINHKGSS